MTMLSTHQQRHLASVGAGTLLLAVVFTAGRTHAGNVSHPSPLADTKIPAVASGRSVLWCFECHYSKNHERVQGNPACLDHFNTADRTVAVVNCTKGSCEKSWLYLTETDHAMVRRCSPDCHKAGKKHSDYSTTCCEGQLCNGSQGRHALCNAFAFVTLSLTVIVLLTRTPL